MEIRLLGPLEVRDGAQVVTLPRRQQRALLAALALKAGEVISTDRLVADLWGERAPASATGSLQNTVSALRKALGRDVVVTQAPGYRLALDRESVDAHRFERLLAAARGVDEDARAPLLDEALALWRGPALADLDEERFARLEAARLDELRVAAQEERIDAELGLGRHASLVGELETLVATHPLRERLRGQLMVTLYRCGRQAEALEVYRAARLALADELGLDPSPELQELERRILRQDPLLAPAAAAVEVPAVEAAAERRLVTVLAAAPPTDDDPERHRLLLDETLAAAQEALRRNGGLLERFGPEGLVAIFGAEAPSDDDALRALAAAEELELPAGIATGEIVAGAGAVVNRAVELARTGGIALDERTSALVGERRRLDGPLVGRDDELARLTAALAEPGCRVLTVVGEPGLGKTRLARELALRVSEDRTVLVARCVAYGAGATFLPLLGALGRAEPERALAAADERELVLARLAAMAGDDPATLGESYWAVRRLLEALSPVLLVLDDVHWAEPALLDLVEYLGERTQGDVLVLCLTRPEFERRLGESLTLRPLGDEDARLLVPAELDAGTRDRIVVAAEGNPLYVEQLSSYAAEGGEGLPPTLEAVLAGRLGRLPVPERAVLQRAAVVGREFSRAAVAALCEAPVDASLSSLSRRGFVHPSETSEPADDGYRFHHVLLRDAAYASLTKADRADLHERAAAWLDGDGPGDDGLVGFHLEQAVLCLRERGDSADALAAAAADRLGAAGMRVWRMNDVAAATGLLERAIELLEPCSTRAELLWELAIALRLAGRPTEAQAALTRAAQDAETTQSSVIAARVQVEQTHAALFDGEVSLDEAVELFAAAIAQLGEAGDERGLGRAELLNAGVHQLAGNLAEFADAAERAEQHYRKAGFSPAAALGNAAEALYYGATPVPEARARCMRLLERCTDRVGEASVTAVLGALVALAGEVSDARLLLEHARELYEDAGNRRGLETIWTPLAVDVEVIAGDLDAAEALARRSVDSLMAQGSFAYATTRAAVLANLLLDRGRPDAAEPYVAIAERHTLASDVLVQILWRCGRARLLARRGEHDAAVSIAEAAVEIASLTDMSCDRARAHSALAEVLALAGRSEAAKQEREAARTLLREKGASALVSRGRPRVAVKR